MRKLKNDAFCAILSGPKELRDKHVNFLSKLGKPIAIFQEVDRNSSPNIIIIREDDMSGAYALGKHLLLKKAKNIVFILSRRCEFCSPSLMRNFKNRIP